MLLNLAEPNKRWRHGTYMNKGRYGHAAVVCNGGVYVIGGTDGSSTFDCIERMDVNGLQRQSSLLRRKLYWTTLDCRLSTGREGFCAAAVHNRYIVIMGGLRVGQRHLQMRGRRSVEILDTRNHTVTVGPRINVPRHSTPHICGGRLQRSPPSLSRYRRRSRSTQITPQRWQEISHKTMLRRSFGRVFGFSESLWH